MPRKGTKLLLQADPSWITASRKCRKNNAKSFILDRAASGWCREVVGASVGASRKTLQCWAAGSQPMLRAANPLDVKTIDALRPRAAAYRVSDGGGLLLEVKPSGAKVWLCRLTVDGKRRDMGLGGYPAVTLKAAREAARKARALAGAGTDPISQRDAAAADSRLAREAGTEAETT